MKQGYLSEYFNGIAVKRLSSVEADILTSNQHEFQGVESLKAILGEPVGRTPYTGKVIYLSDEEESYLTDDATFTWYDVRQGERARGGTKSGKMRWEYRLYFPTTSVSKVAVTGDLLIIAKLRNGDLLVIVAENGSSIERQLLWLFGFDEPEQLGFSVKSDLDSDHDKVEFASRFVLESIGIEVEVSADDHLEFMLNKFQGKFPTTREFSKYARSTLTGIDSREDPDFALITWMEREEVLFRTLERHLISDRLTKGFSDDENSKIDVDGFLSFSLSVQNRRKSRVGLALENHLEFLFSENALQFSRTATTENKAKPDFLFPGVEQYHSALFDSKKLTMLGVKSTCKDRWRQVLAEADRINEKHLLTLETSISKHQTDEMVAKKLQLILPRKLHSTYLPVQQPYLMDVKSFSEIVRSRQS